MSKTLVEVRESYFGYGEIRGDKTYLLCLVEAGVPRKKPLHWLILNVPAPVEGPMVVETIRYSTIRRNGFPRKGCPLKAISITYDPDPNPPGLWRASMKGSWPVRRIRIRRRSIWERLAKIR